MKKSWLILMVPFFLTLAWATPAWSSTWLLPIDGSDKSFNAESWDIKSSANRRAKAGFTFLSNSTRKRPELPARGTLSDKEKQTDLYQRSWGAGRKSVLRFVFDRNAIDGGTLLVYSEPIKGRILVTNFGGFKLDGLLLKQADSRRRGVPGKYHDTVAKGLAWLVKQQHKDGHWSDADGKHAVALTSLAGIALGMEGSTYVEGKYADNIKRATTWLLEQSNAKKPHEGLLGDPRSPDYMHGPRLRSRLPRAVYGEIADKKARDPVKLALDRAVKFAAEAQSSEGGWFDTGREEGRDKSDLAVTIVMLDGLREARNAGIAVPKELRQKGRNYLKDALTLEGGKVYSTGRLGVSAERTRHVFRAAALRVVFDEGEFTDDVMKKWFKVCQHAIPLGGRPRVDKDEFLHYYYAQVVYRLGDAGWQRLFPESAKEERLTWTAYRQARFDFLQATQDKDGSWKDSSSGFGPVYATAVHLTVMQMDNTWLPNSALVHCLARQVTLSSV